MNEAAIYKALGDPVRLEMVKRLAARNDCTVGELSANLGISRQGARKQLQVLVEANVVHLLQHGRQTKVSLDAGTLHAAQAFIARLERQWDERLQGLKQFVEGANPEG